MDVTDPHVLVNALRPFLRTCEREATLDEGTTDCYVYDVESGVIRLHPIAGLLFANLIVHVTLRRHAFSLHETADVYLSFEQVVGPSGLCDPQRLSEVYSPSSPATPFAIECHYPAGPIELTFPRAILTGYSMAAEAGDMRVIQSMDVRAFLPIRGMRLNRLRHWNVVEVAGTSHRFDGVTVEPDRNEIHFNPAPQRPERGIAACPDAGTVTPSGRTNLVLRSGDHRILVRGVRWRGEEKVFIGYEYDSYEVWE